MRKYRFVKGEGALQECIDPCLYEEVRDVAHVCAPHEEVGGERHAADDVSLPSLREDLGLPVLRYDALALQVVQLDLPVVPTQYTDSKYM